MTALSLTLPLPVSANRIWRTKGKGATKSAAYRAWIAAATDSLWQQKPAGGFPFIDGPFVAHIEIPERARGDVDNRIKATLDFMQHAGIVADDKACKGLSCFRADTVAPGSIYVRLFWGDALASQEAA